MISGLIVYSKIDKEKNAWFIKSMIDSLNKKGVSLIYLDENALLEYVDHNKIDFVIYRSRNYELVEELEKRGIRCFNNSLTNKIANDKLLTYQYLTAKGILCLPSFASLEEINEYPTIMKSLNGHGGQEVYLLKAKEDEKTYRKPNKRYLYQKYYPNDGDLRLYVLDKQVIGAVLRKNNNDYRNNFSLGAEVTSYQPEENLIQISLKVASLLNADYVGIDFLKVDGQWLLNEIEDPVGARMLYKASGIDASELLSDYIYRTLTNK